MAELRETDRQLLELTVTLPSAVRARAARTGQMGWLTGANGEQLAITVSRAKGNTTVKYDSAAEFMLQPGDIVQVGSVVPPSLELTPNRTDASRQETTGSAAPQATTAGLVRPSE